MAATGSLNKRANFVASKAHWSKMRGHSGADSRTGDPRQDSICQWLISGYQHDSQPNFCVEPAVSLRKHNSAEDDLDLGVEASLYGKETTHRTTDESHRPLSTSPTLPCRNSGTCASSALSECLSVMDVLNLWHDDPEELLLDLGFGSDEPDIAVKIPARFINHPSQARGINIQVFLEAQKNRIDVENPDLSNRFRQLEVLHQVATAFSSLVSSPPGTQPLATQPASGQPAASRLGTSQPSPEASEKRKRLAMLLRRASRKTLGQSTVDQELQRDPQTGRDPEARSDSHPELQPSLKRSQQFLLHSEGSALSALAEEQGPSPDISRPLLGPTWSIKEAPFRGRLGRDAPSTVPSVQSCKKSPTNGRDRESFELEEIQSFDDSVVTGSVMGPSNGTDSGVVRMNSCQSDSSGFLEEPVIPSQFQQGGPGHELMKTMIAMSEDSSKSQGAQKGCLDTLSPALLFPRPVDKVRTYREGDGSISRSLEVSADPGVYWADCGAKAESNKEGEKEVEDSATQLVDYSAASPTNEEPVGGATDGGGVGVFIEDSHSEEDTEQCTVESRVSLLRDDADRKRSRYLSSEEDTPKLDEEAELPELTAIQSFTEDTGSEESCSGRDQGVSDAPLARSQPSPQAADSDPIAMYLGPDIIGFEGGKPTSGALRSVSVQMPSSLASVSQTLNGRATPATQTSSSEQGRVWYDDDHPLPPDLSLAFPPQHGGQSSEGEFHTRSTSLDTGLAYEEDDEEEETEAGRWKVTAGACCCRCHHSCSCCPPQALHCHCNRRRPCGANHEMQQFTSMSSTFPYSMDELDEMMQCARVFRLVLADIERRLGEEQASLYGELTEEDREDIRVIRDLRLAMRKEAMDLELQLAELAHHYDQGFKTKMHQLLDEQSYLCAQLRIHPPEFQACSPTPIHGVSHAPRLSIAHGLRTRTVATQCSLLPWPPLRDVCDQEGLQIPQYAVDASQPGSEQPLREKQTKPDFVAFLQSLKEPLRSSVTRETLK